MVADDSQADERSEARTPPLAREERKYSRLDAKYVIFREKNPGVSYAQYKMSEVAKSVNGGSAHPTLGANLVHSEGKKIDFWVAGMFKADRYMREGNVTKGQRVIDYGCGSLRVGAHFMKFLEPHNFFGADVIDSFFEIGKKLIGEPLLLEKQPRLEVISDSVVDDLARFSADFIYSAEVCYHVHPFDLDFYFDALKRITAKPGAVLIFDVTLAKEPLRYRAFSWARPLQFFKGALPTLEFIGSYERSVASEKGGRLINHCTLKFRRPL